MAAFATSGTVSAGLGRLRSAMQRYISPILVDSVLQRALDAQAANGRRASTLHAITEDCMIGLRLFVEENELPQLMLDRAFLPDIEAWCRKTGHELRGSAAREGYFEATIRRSA